MTVFTIVLEEREFPSDRVLNTRMEEFEPEVVESRDSAGRVFWRRVEPYRLSVRPFITEFDVGVAPLPIPAGAGPVPAPWGPGPSEEVTMYSYLFTIWASGWMRSLGRSFSSPFPLHFVAYYVSRNSGIDADTVRTHAVSLRSLSVLQASPVSSARDGVVSTAGGVQRVDAVTPLRGVGPSEGVGGPHFIAWTAWTVPDATIAPPRTLADGLTTIDRRMTLQPNTVGRAVAFYSPFPEPPGREESGEQEPILELPFEERIREVVERGGFGPLRKAMQEIDERLERLKQLQSLLKERLKQEKN